MQLTFQISLLVQPDGKKLRLVLTDGSTELACRRETPANLRRFLTSPQTQLFNGRLQLHKTGEAIAVSLKGEQLGVVSIEDFGKALDG